MSKRNVAYIKPDEPAFLKKIKEQVGYKEGPTVDTKRENLNPITDEDLQDTQDEQPTVVVLQPGDLTAEEAAEVNKQRKKEEEQASADLTIPVVFRPKYKEKSEDLAKNKRPSSSHTKDKSKKIKKSLLSFDQEEEEEDN